ncbi:MAG: formimidoylglutamate deiminase [Alphaproteobacteria bacterium]|nr:formimidoylglutamate deiminase [Alphaproteobacteria bacterium]
MSALWFSDALLPSGWARGVRVRIADGRFAAVETGVEAGPEDERHGPAFPGLANVHSHAFQRGMAGLAETAGPNDDDFWSWREAMYRFVLRLDPDEMETIAALAFAEMAEAGFTTVGEFHYLHHQPDGTPYDNVAELAERIAAAAETAGIGLTLLPVFYAHGNFGNAAASPRQARFLTSVDGFARLLEGCRAAVAGLEGAIVGVAPHSLRAAAPDEVRAVAHMAPRGPVHIHAAEQTREVEDCIAHLGARPVEFILDELGADQRWCLIHATHLSESETKWLAASGAVAGLCPVTESNLGDGIFPARAYLEIGGRFGIGTDSNILISAADELKSIEYIQRLTHRARNVLAPKNGSTGRLLFDGAFAGGNQALGLGARGIAQGRPADIVTLDPAHPSLTLAKDDGLLDAWIFAGARIDGVWRAGRQIVAKGRHRAIRSIRARYGRVLARLAA